jgi:hypothetical protein
MTSFTLRFNDKMRKEAVVKVPKALKKTMVTARQIGMSAD